MSILFSTFVLSKEIKALDNKPKYNPKTPDRWAKRKHYETSNNRFCIKN